MVFLVAKCEDILGNEELFDGLSENEASDLTESETDSETTVDSERILRNEFLDDEVLKSVIVLYFLRCDGCCIFCRLMHKN